MFVIAPYYSILCVYCVFRTYCVF